MTISPEDREKVLTRSTEMLGLAREVIKKHHQDSREADEPSYGEEPSIPEMVAVAHLLTNMSAAGLFREKLPEKPVEKSAPSPETIKVIVDSVIQQLDRIIEVKLRTGRIPPPGEEA